ncbi:MAG: hypothetical protein ACREJB_18955, partial [Planctomycetaceae bacterium]
MSTGQQDFLAALQELETAFATPLVPGEFETWLAMVADELRQADAVLRWQIEEVHPGQLEQILTEDISLAPRVEPLREADHALLDRMTDLRRRVEGLTPRVSAAEPDEKRVEEDLTRLADDGLRLLID